MKFLGAILVALAACTASAQEIRIGGTGAALGSIKLLVDAYARESPGFQARVVTGLGGSGSVKAMVAGAIELAIASRPMNAEERALGIVEIEYARTPFVFAVSADSKLSSITSGQLVEIYGGTMAKWPDGTPVRVVLRPPSDIDTHILKSMSREMAEAVLAAEKRRGIAMSTTDQDAADDIARIQGAIGPSNLALLTSEKRPLKVLRLDGREPTVANIASGAYPYYKRMFFVTKPKPPEQVQRFIAFVQSPGGRKVLAQTGHWVP